MIFLYIMWIFLALSGIACVFIILHFGWSNSLKSIKCHAEAIKIVLVVVAALYTGAVYHQQVIDKRIANSLAFSGKLDKGPIRDAFMTLREYWINGKGFNNLTKYRQVTKNYLKLKEQYDKKLIKKKQYEEAYKEWENASELVAKKASEYIKNKGYQKHVVTKHAFYHDIVICVDQNRCDEKTACQIFANDIENFRLNYRKFIDEWAASWEGNQSEVLKSFYFNCKKRGYIN